MQAFSQIIRAGGLAAIATIGAPLVATAHGVNIQTHTTSAIEVQASYSGGEPMGKAQVQVFPPEDPRTPMFTGSTDEAGQFLFVPDRPGDWEISVRQAGHGDIVIVPIESDGTIMEEVAVASTPIFSPLQRTVMAAAVIWGCVGTALFFWRGKR